MKPDAKIKKYQSTVPTDGAVKMSIDENATAHIMDVLTKLYADPELAVIREYATNARDSHIEAGQTRPIEVELPMRLEPFLTIRDFGIGMDADDIANIYSRYGTSMKRESNEAVGMLGLGCKSALSYADQFTLVGRKAGQQTTVLISRDEDGAGTMTVVDECPTRDPDGVTIQVPAKAENSMGEKARTFFQFWPEGTVLVDGEQPARVGGMWLDDHTLLTQSENVGEDLIVMGNVPYPLVEGQPRLFKGGSGQQQRRLVNGRWEWGNAWNAVVFVPIGTVNFAPSRESLMDTKRTRATLDKAREHIKAVLETTVRDKIAAAASARDAQDQYRMGLSLGVKLDDATWNGQVVVTQLDRKRPNSVPGQVDYTPPEDWPLEQAVEHSFLYAGGVRKKNGERSTSFNLDRTDVHIITGFTGRALTNVKRAKLEIHFGGNTPNLVCVDKLTPHEKFWLDGFAMTPWDTIEAIELPKVVTANGTTTRLKGSYDACVKGTTEYGIAAHKLAEEAAKGTPLYWTHGNSWSIGHHRAIREGAIDKTTCVIVPLGANRIDKFCRDFPAAITLDEAAKKAAERWAKAQSDEQIKAYTIQREVEVEVLKKLDPAAIQDPDLREVHRLAAMDTTAVATGLQKFNRWSGTFTTQHPAWANKVLAKYPLYSHITAYRLEAQAKNHLVMYINAAYNAEKGGI